MDREKKKKKKFGLFGKSGDRKDVQSGDDSDNEQDNLEPVPSYELVTQHEGTKITLFRASSHRLIFSESHTTRDSLWSI